MGAEAAAPLFNPWAQPRHHLRSHTESRLFALQPGPHQCPYDQNSLHFRGAAAPGATKAAKDPPSCWGLSTQVEPTMLSRLNAEYNLKLISYI